MTHREAELLRAVGSLCQACGWRGARVVVARSWWRRLLGLIPLSWAPWPVSEMVMVFPSCRSVHTFLMRRAIDIVFVDAAGVVLARADAVKPGVVHTCAAASAVVEHLPGTGCCEAPGHPPAPPPGRAPIRPGAQEPAPQPAPPPRATGSATAQKSFQFSLDRHDKFGIVT